MRLFFLQINFFVLIHGFIAFKINVFVVYLVFQLIVFQPFHTFITVDNNIRIVTIQMRCCL